LLCGAAWDNAQAYFIAFPREPVDETTELVRLLEQQPANTNVFNLGAESYLRFFNEEIFPLDFEGWRLEDVAEPAHFFPLHEALESPVMVVLAPSQTSLAAYAHALYPKMRTADVIGGTNDRLMFRALYLQPEDLARRAGLAVHGSQADDASDSGAIVADPFAADLRVPDSAKPPVWKGRIYWPTDAPVTLTMSAGQPLSLHLDNLAEARVTGAEAVTVPVTLARGWQTLSLEPSGAGPLKLSMSIAGKDTTRAFTRWDLRPDEAFEGLSAVYERDGKVVARTIDPQLNEYADESGFAPPRDLPVRRPFTVAWEGRLRVTQPGTYAIEVRAGGPYTVELDGQPLCQLERVTPGELPVCQVSRDLASGLHPLHARFDGGRPTDPPRRVFQMFWTPPGGERELIPPSHFQPAPTGQQAG